MTTGTKIFLAVFAAFIGVLVLYYGVLMPEAQSLPAISAATRTVPPAQSETKPLTSPSATTANHDVDGSTDIVRTDPAPTPGILTDAMLQAINDPMVGSPIDVSTRSQDQAPSTLGSSVVANQPVSISGDVQTERPKPAEKLQPTPPQTADYTVKSGDTMSSIAQAWFGDPNKWSLIAKENPIADPNRLVVGQKLRLPSKDAKPATVKEQASGDQPLYTVRSGDTLSKIAREYYGDVAKWKSIYDANKSAIGADPANLKPGMKLKLPPPSKPASN